MTRDEIIELTIRIGLDPGSQLEELEAFAHAVERQTLERAARVCDRTSKLPIVPTDYSNGADDCAVAIRSLKEQT